MAVLRAALEHHPGNRLALATTAKGVCAEIMLKQTDAIMI
jgi:hypothetical protein